MPRPEAYPVRLKAVIESSLSGTFNSDEVHTAAFQACLKMPSNEKRATQTAVRQLAKEGYLTEITPLKRRNMGHGMEFTLATYQKTSELEAQN